MRRKITVLWLVIIFTPFIFADMAVSSHADTDEVKTEKNPDKVPTLNILKTDQVLSKEEIFSYHIPGRIKLTIEKMAAFKNWYKERYKTNAWLERKFKNGYAAMGAWDEELKKIFREEFADTDILPEFAELLRFIAIPESHWRIATSPVGAYGHYQIMPGTGKDWGMNIGRYADDMKNIDERRDPLKSARICAKYLKKFMLRYNSLYLAINTWNGTYSEQTFSEQNKATLKLFAEFMEKRVNTIREDTQRLTGYQYPAPRKYTLRLVAKKFRLGNKKINYRDGAKILRKINNFSEKFSINRRFGRRFLITIPVPPVPIEATLVRAEIFNHRIRGIKENFTFLPKVFATIELILEGFVNEVSRARPYIFTGEYTVKQKYANTIYTVRKNDNVWKIARKFPGTKPEDIRDINHLGVDCLIHPGQELIIPRNKGRVITLMTIANELENDPEYMIIFRSIVKSKNITVYQHLKNINPAIIKVRLPLPDGYKIRI